LSYKGKVAGQSIDVEVHAVTCSALSSHAHLLLISLHRISLRDIKVLLTRYRSMMASIANMGFEADSSTFWRADDLLTSISTVLE
jgi:hypothetical protein